MAWVATIVDDDLNVLWDFADTTGGTNPHGVISKIIGIDKGSFSPDRDVFRPGVGHGGSVTNLQYPPVEMAIRLFLDSSTNSFADLRAGVSYLVSLLQTPKTIRLVPDGETLNSYVDTLGSDVAQLWGSADAATLDWLTRQFMRPDGFELRILRQPFFRGDYLDSADNWLLNATLLKGTTTPTGWSWSSTTNITNQLVNPALEAYTFDIATTSLRAFKFEGVPVGLNVGETWCFAIDVRGFVTGSGAAPTNLRVQVCLRYRNSGGTDIGSDTLSTLVNPGNDWTRIFVTAVAPGLTASVRPDVRFTNTSASSVTVNLRNAKLEEAATPSQFSVGTETMNNDPTAAAGRVALIYNPGDAPTPVTFRIFSSGAEPDGPQFAVVGIRGSDGVVGKNLVSDYANVGYFIQAEAMDNGTGTSTVSVAAYSGGSGKQTVFTDNTYAVRISKLLSAAQVAPLRGGSWVVIPRVATTDDAEYSMRLEWAYTASASVYQRPREDATLAISGEIQTFATDLYEPPLGTLWVPEDASGLYFRVRVTRTSGTASLRWDLFDFVPAEWYARLGNAAISFGGRSLVADPETPRVYIGGSSGAVEEFSETTGPVPAWVGPGLSAVYCATGYTFAPNSVVSFGSRLLATGLSPRTYG